MSPPTSALQWDETFSYLSYFISASLTKELAGDTGLTTGNARKVMSTLCGMRKKLDAMIEQSRRSHTALLKREADVRKCIRGLETLLSPARRLPPELVCEIFQQFVKSNAVTHLPLRLTLCLSPLTLAQVSRSWRSVALAMPAIWSSIHITIPEEVELTHANRISHMIRLWMERSGDSFLTLRFTIFHSAGAPRISQSDQQRRRQLGAALHPIFTPLLQHSQRWRKLLLDVTPMGMMCLLAEHQLASVLTAPALDVFQLKGGIRAGDVRWLGGHPFRLGPWFNLSSAHTLRHLSLSDIGLFVAHEHSFQWAQLEELSLVGINFTISGPDCMFALKRCKKLKRLHLTCSENTRVVGGSINSSIVLDALETFHVTSYCLPDISDIYRLLVCPNLEEFTFRYLPHHAEEIHHHHLLGFPVFISGFLAHSPLLLKLHLWNAPILEDGIISIAELVSSVTHLTVVCQRTPYFVGDGLLQRLSIPPSDERSLLKNMKYIHIESRIYSEHFIREFVESRLWGNLKEIRLGLHGTETGLYCDLASYQAEGLIIEILTPC